ncbi:serine/threonine-protein kinase ATM-like [Drosophila innubila]|uniref:serine/threonine-protein kinase ATM-like n=1 Tax=Drosophila innubila TaxID=198719 RepID=UPI00148DF509|nr:serine/threonine-protein kinase ATM-like [Drosophila innubila]
MDTVNPSDAENAPNKRLRLDQMDSIIQLIDKKETSFNDIWFAIFAELLQLSNSIIDTSNYQQTLQTTLDVLLIYGNGKNLRNVRLCLMSILDKEQELLQKQAIPIDFLYGHWSQIATHLISDTRPNADVVLEKQIILQSLIRHNKLTPNNCATLLQSIQTNEMLRRNECITTIRDIFIYAERCGLNKASAELEPIINWAYGSERSSATQIIYNIAAIDVKLMADTFAIGIINFLDEQQLQQLFNNSSECQKTCQSNLQLLNYKYNKQLVCLAAEFQGKLLRINRINAETELETKNCLFQNNYELLMRLLNLPTSNEHTTTAIIRNLKCLYKFICTMERLLYYKVFNAENLVQCPLIKRIGLFLSHIEFQYKANQPESMNDNDLRDILEQQIAVIDVFNSNEILLQYLEKQPIEMLLEFIGALLKHNCSARTDPIESADRAVMIKYSLHILGRLCANSSYSTDAFRHISSNVKQARHQSAEVLMVTKMLCSCKSLTSESIEWLVDKLKSLFQHFYTNVDVISELVEHLPTIFYFVYHMEDLLDDMMMAMISLLKLALKKSYPTQLAIKIVNCVADIAQRCPNIFELENFAIICMSVAKFLSMPTLEVRLATISTLSLLLNTSYCMPDQEENAVNKSERHLEFCRQLYDSIEWNKFLAIHCWRSGTE